VEKPFQEGEDWLRSAMEHSAIGMALVELDGHFLKVNQALCDIVGHTEAELLATDFQSITHPDDLDADLAQVKRLAGGEIASYLMEKRYFHKQGHIVWILLTVSLARNRDGQPLHFISQIQDITDRKRIDETMRRDVQIFAQLEDCVLCTDFNGQITYWNEAATRLHGWTFVEMRGHSLLELFPPEHQAQAQRDFATLVELQEFSGEREVCNKDNSRVWVQIDITPFKGDLNHPIGFIVLARNVTGRRLAEEKIRQSEAMMAAAEHLAHFGSWELDLGNPEVDVNPLRWSDECHRIFGFEPGAVVVTNELFFSRVPPDDHEVIHQAVNRAIAERGVYSVEHRVILPGGEVRHVHEQAKVLVDDSTGLPRKMIGTTHDITERRVAMEEMIKAKNEAEIAAHAKSEFLAMISHEIRTPLNPILGAAQLLLGQECAPEQRELLKIIQNAGEHLLTLLNDILDLAKLESGGASLYLSPCQISELVQGVLDIKSEDARSKGLALNLQLDSNLAFCYLIDEPRLRQILLNFVGNAVKFTNQGSVTVCVDRLEAGHQRDLLRFNVRDTGIGLSPAHTARIFEPFYQVDSSATRRYEGAGLGLSICRRLVEMMGGDIGVESRLKEGSTFWFSAWLERRRSLLGSGTPWPMPLNNARRRSVLLVEQNDQCRVILASMLDQAGCEITQAETGAGALALFRPGIFDLVLLNLHLPDLDGRETATLIRERERAAGAKPVPIIAQTVEAERPDAKALENSGLNGVLLKPVRQVDLLNLLNLFATVPAVSRKSSPESPPSGLSCVG
jgi:PAS domain S-box-containing protein